MDLLVYEKLMGSYVQCLKWPKKSESVMAIVAKSASEFVLNRLESLSDLLSVLAPLTLLTMHHGGYLFGSRSQTSPLGLSPRIESRRWVLFPRTCG